MWDWGVKCWKSNVWIDVTVRRSSWSGDDNKLVEFFRIHMLLTPLRMVLVLQYLTNPSFTVLSSLVRRHGRSFVVHLMEPAINLCLYGNLCNFGVHAVQIGQILIFFKHFQSHWCDEIVVTLHDCLKWVICWDICWVIAAYIVYFQLFNQGVSIVLLAHNYHIIGSFVCRDQNMIGM